MTLNDLEWLFYVKFCFFLSSSNSRFTFYLYGQRHHIYGSHLRANSLNTKMIYCLLYMMAASRGLLLAIARGFLIIKVTTFDFTVTIIQIYGPALGEGGTNALWLTHENF